MTLITKPYRQVTASNASPHLAVDVEDILAIARRLADTVVPFRDGWEFDAGDDPVDGVRLFQDLVLALGRPEVLGLPHAHGARG